VFFLKGKIPISQYLKFAVIGLVTGIANGLFGSGGGTIVVPAMVLLLKRRRACGPCHCHIDYFAVNFGKCLYLCFKQLY